MIFGLTGTYLALLDRARYAPTMLLLAGRSVPVTVTVTVTVFITIHKRNCTDLIIWHTNKNKIYKTDLRYEFAVFRSWK